VDELILASASPRRRELLAATGRAFRVVPSDAEETVPEGLSPTEAAEHLACRKAAAVAARLSRGIVIGADTIVTSGPDIIGKPTDREDAIHILESLSRRAHTVITGLCLIDARSGRRLSGCERTRVQMRRMDRREIEAYVDSGEAIGKAGAYAIQESGDRFVERIEGSLSNVVGLPMELLERLLRAMESSSDERRPG
jgi:septum formation protein